MILYHRTDYEAAVAICNIGFRDGAGSYMTRTEYRGVWVSNVPLDENEGAFGDTLLRIDTTIDTEQMAVYGWTSEGQPLREYLIPSELLNSTSKIEIIDRRIEPEWATDSFIIDEKLKIDGSQHGD